MNRTNFDHAWKWSAGPLLALALLASARAEELSFNRDVRPILSANCFACHGPDKHSRKADRRLDTHEGAIAELDGVRAIVPGDAAASEVTHRISSTDPDEVMPPPKSDKKLKPEEIAILKKWIAQGAKYEPHWSLIAPARPAVPTIPANFATAHNPIDSFILARLQKEGLTPSAEASKTALIRRVSFDLTGLPPTLAEVDAFLADNSAEAYEKLVDRLLASPRYGERMTRDWLDVSRYADTHGYHLDSGRDMWLWRDWVIAAFNANMRFDQFTIEQIAGDLLPNATDAQRVATGFHRNSMINFEGGALPEEYLTQYVKDRVATTSTVYLGLTLQCAECHDHKFDPVTQKEFYEMYAFFNAVPENGIDGSRGNAVPLMRVLDDAQKAKVAELTAAERAAERALADALPEIDAVQRAWEEDVVRFPEPQWTTVEIAEVTSQGGATFTKLEDRSVLAGGPNPAADVYEVVIRGKSDRVTAFQIEALPDASFAGGGTGRASNGNFLLSAISAHVRDAASGVVAPIKLARADADYAQNGYAIGKALDGDANTGWAVDGDTRKAASTGWFAAERAFAIPADGELRVKLHFESSATQHAIGRFRFALTSDAAPLAENRPPKNIRQTLELEPARRDAAQRDALAKYFREKVSSRWTDLNGRIASAKKAAQDFQNALPTVMVMQQAEKPRESFVLVRGEYDKRGEKVEPNVPASLPPLAADAPRNRLGLAKWLVDPKNPLVARVTVNRFWQNIMGTGIVKTSQDFGSQAEWPSHPELLDWLAVDFVESGWDVKRLVKQIVMSATYRQSAKLTPELRERDPENRLYARGPRFRLGAEEIRDSALAVSGLLVEKIGGPSVRPYQPAGLWEELSSRKDSDNFSAQKFVQDKGENLYRRSMYTFWKRTSPPPSLTTFDAPDREKCTVSRERTNTPLQALVLMNDPTYVEASRKLAERMIAEGGASPAERVAFAFRLASARMPSEAEARALVGLYEKQRARFTTSPAQADALLAIGESPRNAKLDSVELAAWTAVASTILNLDETVTKG